VYNYMGPYGFYEAHGPYGAHTSPCGPIHGPKRWPRSLNIYVHIYIYIYICSYIYVHMQQVVFQHIQIGCAWYQNEFETNAS
jgi:hypothetical protein